MADDFKNDASAWITRFKALFANGSYADVLGFVQFILRQKDYISPDFWLKIEMALRDGCAAYRVLDEDTVIPITNEQELGCGLIR